MTKHLSFIKLGFALTATAHVERAEKANRSSDRPSLMRRGLGTLARLSHVTALLGIALVPAQGAPLQR